MRRLLFLVIFVLPLRTFAQETEFFHQPAAQINEITPHAGYRTSTIRLSADGSRETNFNGLDRIGFRDAYGVNANVALGFDLAYSKFKTASGADSRGFEPLELFIQTQYQTTFANLEFGLRSSLGLEKAISGDPANRSLGDPLTNYPAGGLKLVPWVGAALRAGPGIAGLRIEYSVLNTNVDVDTSSVATTTLENGAHGLAVVFYEIKAANTDLGAALTYDFFDTVRGSLNGSEQTVFGSHSLIGTRLYARLPYGDWQFLPSLSWREKATGDDFDKTGDLHLTIAGRFSF